MATSKKKATKKDTNKKKVSEKKEKVLKINEEQVQDLKEVIIEGKPIETNDVEQIFEKYETPYNEIDMTDASKEEIETVFENLKPDDKIIVVKEEEKIEEKAEKSKPQEKPIKKIIKRIDRTIGYFWNGQAIDF